MNKSVSNSLLLLFLTGALMGVAIAATLDTGDLSWAVIGGIVALGGMIAILFFRPPDQDDAAKLDLVFGDMSDPRQRWPMIRAMVWAVPHSGAMLVLTLADGPLPLWARAIAYAVFVVTGALIGLESWRFARVDPYFVHFYGPPIAKACGVFVMLAIIWRLAVETFAVPAVPFLAQYILVCSLISGFAYGQDEFKRTADE